MKNDPIHAEAREQYAAAHAAHYTAKNLREALDLYRSLTSAHPDTLEAGYSRSQIQNIVNAVIPKQDLFDAHVELALAHFGCGVQPNGGAARVCKVFSVTNCGLSSVVLTRDTALEVDGELEQRSVPSPVAGRPTSCWRSGSLGTAA